MVDSTVPDLRNMVSSQISSFNARWPGQPANGEQNWYERATALGVERKTAPATGNEIDKLTAGIHESVQRLVAMSKDPKANGADATTLYDVLKSAADAVNKSLAPDSQKVRAVKELLPAYTPAMLRAFSDVPSAKQTTWPMFDTLRFVKDVPVDSQTRAQAFLSAAASATAYDSDVKNLSDTDYRKLQLSARLLSLYPNVPQEEGPSGAPIAGALAARIFNSPMVGVAVDNTARIQKGAKTVPQPDILSSDKYKGTNWQTTVQQLSKGDEKAIAATAAFLDKNPPADQPINAK